MTENFDKETRNLFRNICHSKHDQIIYNIINFLNYIIINDEIISKHKYKDNIKKIVDKELEKILTIKTISTISTIPTIPTISTIHNSYYEKIRIIFDDAEYDVI